MLPVIPAKLVKRIQKGEFVDMAELLKDNIEAERRRLAVAENSSSHNPRREIPNLLGWLYCYSLFAEIVCAKYPDKAKKMWAYQATIIGESRRCGGSRWHLYDTAFRQQMPSLESTDFSKLSQALYTTTFLAYRGKGQFCQICMMSDHTSEEYALSTQQRDKPARNRGQQSYRQRSPDAKRKRRGVCYSWNDGSCYRQPHCPFEHRCSACTGDHKRVMCPLRNQTKEKSEFCSMDKTAK